MKTKTLRFLPLVALAVLSMGAIRWHRESSTPWFEIKSPGGTNFVQFGLRDDGIVVWREINHGTNSPAEQPVFYWNITNVILNTYP